MIGYRKNLERDLERWREKGIIGADAEAAIRADMKSRGGIPLAPVLALLGAVLLCFAAMTFVAANWQEMPKLARLALLFCGLWGAYAAAWVFQRYAMPYFAQAAILLGVGLFGASIMLVAQMYHISGNPPDAVLTWAGGSLLAGVVLRSRPALALTVALVSLWSWWEVTERHGVHYPFLAVLLLTAVPVAWLRWRTGYHLLAIALAAWIIGLGYLLDDWRLVGTEAAQPLVVVAGLIIMLAGLVLHGQLDRKLEFAGPVAVYGLGIAFAGLFAMQVVEDAEGIPLLLFAVFTLALAVGALFYGRHTENGGLVRAACLVFSIELLALYFKTLGTLLDTALFFLVAGLIVVGLASLTWRLSRT